SDRPELVVDLTLPRNASIFASDTVAGKLDGMLKGDPDVASWSTYVGRGAIRFYLPLDVQLPNDFFSQVRSIALKLGQIMGADPNLRLVNFDWIEPSREVRIKIDQDQARLVGLSSQALADVLNTVMTGAPVTQVRDDIYLVNVVARANDEQRVSLSTLRSLQLPLPNGRTGRASPKHGGRRVPQSPLHRELPRDAGREGRPDTSTAFARRVSVASSRAASQLALWIARRELHGRHQSPRSPLNAPTSSSSGRRQNCSI